MKNRLPTPETVHTYIKAAWYIITALTDRLSIKDHNDIQRKLHDLEDHFYLSPDLDESLLLMSRKAAIINAAAPAFRSNSTGLWITLMSRTKDLPVFNVTPQRFAALLRKNPHIPIATDIITQYLLQYIKKPSERLVFDCKRMLAVQGLPAWDTVFDLIINPKYPIHELREAA